MSVVKIGCTERSPHTRAEELSRSTGVPSPFSVVAYLEVPEFQAVERDFHRWLEAHRVSEFREFFDVECAAYAMRLMAFHPERLAFVLCDEVYAAANGFGRGDEDPFGPRQILASASAGRVVELFGDGANAAQRVGGFD